MTDALGQTGTSTSLCLPSYWPMPQITSVNPSSFPLDGQAHTVTISGTNFWPDAVVYTNYTYQLPTQYVSSNTLNVTITANPYQWSVGSETLDVFQLYSNLSNVNETISFR